MMSQMNNDWFWDWRYLVGGVILGLILTILMIRVSLWLAPPKSYDPNFTSRKLTGWTNTPKKLAWSRTLDKVSEPNDLSR